MPRPDGLRERKKRETRQMISDTATRLFTERGFDRVTIEEVAAASNVSKMTVFNYFARKEDLLFDRTDDVQPLLREALAERGRRSPLTALHMLARDLIEQQHALARVTPGAASFWQVVSDSPALRARTRELNEELERALARLLVESVGGKPSDPIARLIASLLFAAWRVAFREGLRRHRTGPTRPVIRALLDRGFAAARAAARGSPYV